jgi:S-adenosylmethionine:tRNA ribosyltransferase-isomerase
MNKSELQFEYPHHLISTQKKSVSRVMCVENQEPIELTAPSLLTQIEPSDILVINDSKVIPARIHAENAMEILFINEIEQNVWQVLCPAKRWPKNQKIILPEGVELDLLEKSLPQIIKTNKPLNFSYFEKYGQMPLPPYIQEARGERLARDIDKQMYQTTWAKNIGSLAAPTASLHFSKDDLVKVKNRGAQVHTLTLHVGLGTFLPIHSQNLNDHKMHSEKVTIPKTTWQATLDCKAKGGKVWALGSTVTRALESMSLGMFNENENEYWGESDLFIKPPFEYKIVDRFMTNFHQPESSLLAMVMAFAGVENVKNCYKWAIERNFLLFSYGDLSVWKK